MVNLTKKERAFHETYPSVALETIIQYQAGKSITKGTIIRYKGVKCRVLRIDGVRVHEMGITVTGRVTPLESGLN